MFTDEDLFRAWQHGDAGALETLVQRYHAPLLALTIYGTHALRRHA